MMIADSGRAMHEAAADRMMAREEGVDRAVTPMEAALRDSDATSVRLDEVQHELAHKLAKVLLPERPEPGAEIAAAREPHGEHVEAIEGVTTRLRRCIAFVEDLIVRLEV